MKVCRNILLYFIFFCKTMFAQFPGPAGTSSSTAIHKDSSIFSAWANNCVVVRGYQNISDTTLGLATAGLNDMATGQADGAQVVSLGDGGYAIVTFEYPIKNGPGYDFAVFENGFIDEFLELAFVEVSSDGVNFFRFKATSNTQTDIQIGPFDYNADASLMNNLAGKYRAMYGTPFDLEELNGTPGLQIDSITHLKIIDVVGSINPLYGSVDQYNNLINDHFPTPFPQGGFDLDAVGVIHSQPAALKKKYVAPFNIFPNPFTNEINVKHGDASIIAIEISNYMGVCVFHESHPKDKSLNLSHLEAGIYLIKAVHINGKTSVIKVVKK